MNALEVRTFLSEAGVTPSRKLGQNFLIDADVARGIVDHLNIQPDDTVVEVGPGTGALTEHVIDKAKRIILVEFDYRLAASLTERFKDVEHLTVIHADGAQFDTRPLFAEAPIKFLGNLPYSAGGAIMRNFLERPCAVEKAVLMLQKEVIDRMVGEPRTKQYGVLSLRIQSEWEANPVMVVPPEVFHPAPKVDSTVALLTRRTDPLPAYDDRLFDSLIRRGFSQRRKQVRKQMPDSPEWPEVCAEVGISETSRAEEISLDEWIQLTQIYDDNPLKDIPQKDSEIFDVVDENDEVLRQERRDVIHRDGLIHRAVHIFVFNKRKEIFLQKRSRFKDKCPNLWDSSAAGHLDAGESYESSAIRELEEEIAVQAEVQHLAQLPPSELTGWEHIGLFLARHDGAVRYPCSEVETGMWLGFDEVQHWLNQRPQDFAPGFIECWKVFSEQFQARNSEETA